MITVARPRSVYCATADGISAYYGDCVAQGNSDEARKQLLDKIVERVFVHNHHVIALVLHGSFGVVLSQNETTPTHVVDAVQQMILNEEITVKLDDVKRGSDGVRSRAGLVIFAVWNEVFTRTLEDILTRRAA